MKTFRWLAASTMALAAVPLAAASMGTFSPYRLSEIDKTISSDAFEGRGVNTPAEVKSVNYIIDQFRSAELQPGGDMVNGKRSWTQNGAAAAVRDRRHSADHAQPRQWPEPCH